MRKLVLGAVLALALCVATNAPAQPAAGWSMYHNGVQGMGYTLTPSTLSGAGIATPLWVVNAPGGVWGSPIEDLLNGAVVVGTNAAPELYVLNQFTGAHMFGSPIPLTSGWTDGTGVIDTWSMNYVIAAQNAPGSMDAFQTWAGYVPAWTDVQSGGLSTKLTTWDETIYSVASPPGAPGIYTWNAAVGNSPPVLHTLLPAGQTVDVWHGFLSMDAQGQFLYYKDAGVAGVNETSQLHCINRAAGGIVWSTAPHGDGWGNTPTLVDTAGDIYAGFQDVDFDPNGIPNDGDEYVASTLEKYNPGGGLVWQMQFNGGGAWWHGGVAMSPDEQVIYALGRGGNPGAGAMGGLTAVDANTGAILWTVYTQTPLALPGEIGDCFGAPAVDGDGNIFGVDHNGTFFGVTPAGTVMFGVDGAHTSSWASPAILSDGTIITTGDEGNIVAWTVPEPSIFLLAGLGLLALLRRRKK